MNIEDSNLIESITIQYSGIQVDGNSKDSKYFGNDYYIKKNTIQKHEEIGDLVRKSNYQGPSTATMTVTETISASFNFSLSIGSKDLNAKLGYNRISTFQISDSYSISIPENRSRTIKCYVLNEVSTFEIWEDDVFKNDYVGKYSSAKPIGYSFVNYLI